MESFTDKSIKALNPQLWLANEFSKRKSRNPSYSLRAFSNFLKLDPSSVSQILTGKRQVSGKMILKLIETIGADPETKIALVTYSNTKVQVNQAEIEQESSSYRQLTMDAFSLISDWYHYAILELTFVAGFRNDPQWIGNTLGISVLEVTIALDRLKRLNLIEEVEGRLLKTEAFITNFKDGLTSDALKNLQRSTLSMALEAIDNTPKEEKDITSMTFAINEEKLPEARERIKTFRRDMSLLLEAGTQTRVYHLGVQLYPISKKET